MVRIPIPNPIEYLLKRRFPEYGGPRFVRTLPGSSYEGQQRSDEIEEYRANLRGRSPDELQALCELEQAKERDAALARSEFEERQRFFNQPRAKADFAHWSKAAIWTLDEAIALCLGKGPEVVNWESIKGFINVSPFVVKYARVRDLAMRAKACKQLYDPALPGFFLAWARRTEIEVPPELVLHVEKRGTVIADWKDMYDKLKAQYDELLAKANEEIGKGNAALAKYQAERESWKSENAQLSARNAEMESSRWDGFDPESGTYPSELDIALQASRAVTISRTTNATAKEQIEGWLDTHYPDRRSLSNEARQRIAVMCNWEKSGGRPLREDK